MGKMLTMKDIAERLNVNKMTVWNWINDKGLPATKIGKVIRIDPNEFEKWLQDKKLGD